ncbi:MAG: hypothetical protein J1E06_06605 [Acutalibacter sp.]|nr:hypothetical protein [Acutalibacter sp.]
MAQRTIHYLFAELISREIPVGDKNRFLLGSVLPDAFSEVPQRQITHFKRGLPDNRTIFDFDAFKEEFGGLMLRDSLYLGYYLHLAEDAFYRQFIYHVHPMTIDDVEALHRDYHLLNSYIVGKYGLTDTVRLPEDFDTEPICQISSFTVGEFLADMENDFRETVTGKTHFLTEDMLDEFVERYLPEAIEDARQILQGKTYLRAEDFAYVRKV